MMPRCNLTLKQKCQIIELSGDLSTEQLAKKFRVHPTTVTRTVKNKDKILDQASRVNINFKTVQTNQRGEEHDTMILNYIKSRQAANEPLSIKDICDKAVECAKILDRNIKSKRGWWRRFKVRCNIIKSKLQKTPPTGTIVAQEPEEAAEETEPKENDETTRSAEETIDVKEEQQDTPKEKIKREKKPPNKKSPKKTKKNSYTFKVKENTK